MRGEKPEKETQKATREAARRRQPTTRGKEKKCAYKCICTPEELESIRLKIKKDHINLKRLCTKCEKDKNIQNINQGYCIRIKIPENGEISLSDNIQETFGITPLEGMASKLPVIVSDWDGYKSTVRNDIDGYRVKTYALKPGLGEDLAYNHMMDFINYDHYIGKVFETYLSL